MVLVAVPLVVVVAAPRSHPGDADGSCRSRWPSTSLAIPATVSSSSWYQRVSPPCSHCQWWASLMSVDGRCVAYEFQVVLLETRFQLRLAVRAQAERVPAAVVDVGSPANLDICSCLPHRSRHLRQLCAIAWRKGVVATSVWARSASASVRDVRTTRCMPRMPVAAPKDLARRLHVPAAILRGAQWDLGGLLVPTIVTRSRAALKVAALASCRKSQYAVSHGGSGEEGEQRGAQQRHPKDLETREHSFHLVRPELEPSRIETTTKPTSA